VDAESNEFLHLVFFLGNDTTNQYLLRKLKKVPVTQVTIPVDDVHHLKVAI
jgi:hypothetical protein